MRFSIRDLLWLTILAGALAGWSMDHSRFSSRFAALAAENAKLRSATERAELRAEEAWRILSHSTLLEHP